MGIFENNSELVSYIWLLLGTAFLSLLLTRIIIFLATRYSWIVLSNERSCHDGVKLTGGGSVVIVLALAAWLIFAQPFDPVGLTILSGTIALGIASWIDDLYTVHFGLRLCLQVLVVSAVLWFLPADQRILPDDWSLLMERALTGLCWVWLINLYNFMDGIDGLATCETISIAIGLFIIGSVIGFSASLLTLTVALGGTALGFLTWNWHDSRIFLGDTGAIPIGFLIGFLLMNLAFNGYVVAALILPLYFLIDASMTLARRILSGEKFWEPHKEHFYQRVVEAGFKHDHVVLKIITANIVLLAAAFWSISQPIWAALVAVITVALLLIHLQLMTKR